MDPGNGRVALGGVLEGLRSIREDIRSLQEDHKLARREFHEFKAGVHRFHAKLAVCGTIFVVAAQGAAVWATVWD